MIQFLIPTTGTVAMLERKAKVLTCQKLPIQKMSLFLNDCTQKKTINFFLISEVQKAVNKVRTLYARWQEL